MGDDANRQIVTAKDYNTTSLQISLLTPVNYTVWVMKMKVILNVNSVWEMIEPGTAANAKKNNIAIALLFQGIPEALVLQIGNLTTAKEMWEAIKNRHQG